MRSEARRCAGHKPLSLNSARSIRRRKRARSEDRTTRGCGLPIPLEPPRGAQLVHQTQAKPARKPWIGRQQKRLEGGTRVENRDPQMTVERGQLQEEHLVVAYACVSHAVGYELADDQRCIRRLGAWDVAVNTRE